MSKEKIEDLYKKFKEYDKKKDYSEMYGLITKYPVLKNSLTKEELITMTSVYENIIENMFKEKIDNMRRKINEMPSRFERRFGRFREDLCDIMDDGPREI